jgi:mannose-6-phosphate isomerase-like protein (cupin superfamily)
MKFIPASDGEFIAASHENATNPGVLKRVIATHNDLPLGQVMMVNWARLPGNSSFQRHYHEDMQEVFVLISGHVAMTVDENTVELSSGDTVIVAPHEIHQMQNLKNSVAEYLVFGVSTGQGGQTRVVGQT